MIPREILRRLGQLRRRERLLRLVWGLARCVGLIAGVILLACAADWLWDRSEETPQTVRMILLIASSATALVGLVVWIIGPQAQRLTDDGLALAVEEKHPRFQNRLISAVQLNRPGADKQGMSEELVGVVTREAESQAAGVPFTSVADHRRFTRAAAVLLPVTLLAAGLFFWDRELCSALLARHFMGDVEVPRRTHLEPVHMAKVYPAGDKIPIAFRVTGDDVSEDSVGTLDVTPLGQPRDRYDLKFDRDEDKDGVRFKIFQTTIAPSSTDLSYTARLADGRMKRPAKIQVVPRPAVVEQMAFSVLPAYCGVKPSGQRYEAAQPRGDVIGIDGSSAKVIIKTQKPIESARLEILEPESPKKAADKAADKADESVKEPAKDEIIPERVSRTVNCQIEKDKMTATGMFDLKENETGYRVIVADEYGFENTAPPRRTLRIVPEEPPTVVMLKDYFTPLTLSSDDLLEDFYVDGIPIPIGESLRAPYLAEGPYGLGQAWFLYRVIRKTESGNDAVEEEPWRRLPLPEERATAKTGEFDKRRGVFANTPPDKGVSFVALDSENPEITLGRTVGGGRYHLATSGLIDRKGNKVKLEDGDKIEYCIEVHADKGGKDGRPGRPIARSETRVQSVGTHEGLVQWMSDVLQERDRLKKLDDKQRAVFGQP